MHRLVYGLLVALWSAGPTLAQPGVKSAAQTPYLNFESGPTRPLLLSGNGSRLYVCNSPDNRVEVFNTTPGLTYSRSYLTGLEPFALALDESGTVDMLYVVNNVSDSVTVVDVTNDQVLYSLAVGDEPQDIVLVGNHLYVATARAINPTTQAWEENVVQVFDVTNAVVRQIAHITLQAHKPRALARNGSTVYVVPLNSGNHTTILGELELRANGITQAHLLTGDPPLPPNINFALLNPALSALDGVFGGWTVPITGRILLDTEKNIELTNFNLPTVPLLPDNDLIAINDSTLAVSATTTGVGTTLFNLGVHPATNDIWILSTESKNRTRFENVLKGNAFENRVTVMAPGNVGQPAPAPIRLDATFTSQEHAQPVSLAFYNGTQNRYAYVGAMGTSAVIVIDANTRNLVQEISTQAMPIGLAVDSTRDRLYVLSRDTKSLQAYDIGANHAPVGTSVALPYDPEPDIVTVGRRHLYDARASTNHGSNNSSCASCHIFGHLDHLAWDLGSTEGGLGYYFPDLLIQHTTTGNAAVTPGLPMVHPAKGPLTTQTLRGIIGDEPHHWRGDRRFFQNFRVAFKGLLGNPTGLTSREMQEFTSFVDSLAFPPNPFQSKNRTYSGQALAGVNTFRNKDYTDDDPATPGLTCLTCHEETFTQGGNNFTGGQLSVVFDGEPQNFNPPPLRGIYEKNTTQALTGFSTHLDGTLNGVRGFLDLVFSGGNIAGGGPAFPTYSNQDKADVTAFVNAWDTGVGPLVGTQLTWDQNTASQTVPYPKPMTLAAFRSLAEAQAQLNPANIDLTLRGYFRQNTLPWETGTPGAQFIEHGAVFMNVGGNGWAYAFDTRDPVTNLERCATFNQLQSLVLNGDAFLVFTAVPPGQGIRAIDRDEDGRLDADEGLTPATNPAVPDTDQDGFTDGTEVAAGSNPTQASSVPNDTTPPQILAIFAKEVFNTTATVRVVTDEPALVSINIAGQTFPPSPQLQVVHDVVLSALPAGTVSMGTVSAIDAAANSTQTPPLPLGTVVPFFHVDDIVITKFPTPQGAVALQIDVTVVLQNDNNSPVPQPVPAGVPVWILVDGDIGGAPVIPTPQVTNTSGVATFQVPAYTPAVARSPVTATVLTVGNINSNTQPWFVGFAGIPNQPTQHFAHFYQADANRRSYRMVFVP